MSEFRSRRDPWPMNTAAFDRSFSRVHDTKYGTLVDAAFIEQAVRERLSVVQGCAWITKA